MTALPARIAALAKHTSSCLPVLIRVKAAASLPARAVRAVLGARAGIVPPAAGISSMVCGACAALLATHFPR